MNGQRLARGLGAFSLGLGLVQLVNPRRFSDWIGVKPRDESEASIRLVGVRELAAAGALLVRPRPIFMWMRVAGDVMDLALLGQAMRARNTRADRVGAAMGAVAGVTAVDLVGTLRLARAAGRSGRTPEATGSTTLDMTGGGTGPRRIVRSVTVERSPEELYGFWRQLDHLPRFMPHLERVDVLDADRSHWVARAPLGLTVEWDAEITEDVPNTRLSWRAVEGSTVSNAGTVRFERAPAGRGTRVTADFEYDPPGGPLGVAIAKLTGQEPEQQASDDLRRFKQILETGDVVVSDATVGDRKVRQRPAQPTPAEG